MPVTKCVSRQLLCVFIVLIISSIARLREVNPARIQYWPRYSVCRAATFSGDGALHRRNLQAVRPSMEGESLLLTHSVLASILAFCAEHGSHAVEAY